jgi:hypothetical protein
MLKIIHISDFHLESAKASYDKEQIVKALCIDIKKYVDENTLVFFTGDLIDNGGKDFKSQKEIAFLAFEEILIDEVLKSCPSLKNHIFVVPGNHDVFRDKIDVISEAGLKKDLNSEAQLDNFIDSNRDSVKHLERLFDYKEWEKLFYASYTNKHLSNFENTFIVELKDYEIGITCLNSSWLCKDDSDKENLLIGRKQIHNSLELIKNCPIKIALAHHPMEFLADFDKEIIKNELYNNYDGLFTGHVHELSSSYIYNIVGSLFISIANSTIADRPIERKFVNGYSVIELHPNNKIKAHYRKYIEISRNFVANTDIGKEDGTAEFPLLKDEKLIAFEILSNHVKQIYNQHAERLNNHLIVSSNNTDVNCSIDHLFVEPTILNYPEGSVKKEDSIKYTIENILSGEKNFLIFGPKESGKTILLDKCFLEGTVIHNKIEKIPIILKFSDFRNQTPEQLIRSFLGLSSALTHEFMSKNKTILFIDDINFADKNSYILDKLKDILIKYPKIQLVSTCNITIENVIPTDYLAHNQEFNFEIGFIQTLNSSQIKQLINKWFAGKEIDFQDKMEKLLKSFKDFGLPKTPLSVTLFLWIFEKQEKKPINNSVLVEMFIENLLEKTNIENIYSETFDFKNKQRLLSFIAKHMRDKGDGDLNYSIDYVILLDYVDSYLKTRFSGQPQKVLDDLILRGILTFEGENSIKFKAAFAFHYFLALHFDYDKSFKAEVFEGDNYLNYIEEITYYSGLKRDDLEILLFTQARLNDAFGKNVIELNENWNRIDKVLEPSSSDNTISYNIDNNKIALKPSEEQINDYYDAQLSTVPTQTQIQKKGAEKLESVKNVDLVLSLAASVLKNSEDVDSFEEKTKAYKNTIVSSIIFLMGYRDSLLIYYEENKKKPEVFPDNIDFNLFIKVLPLIHQVLLFDWLGSPKLRPVVIDKIEKDKFSLNTSDYERFLSIFIYADIRGTGYPYIIKNFIKTTRYRYAKDISFLKIMSYYHLRKNSPELDEEYLKMLSEIREDLGLLDKNMKSQFKKRIEDMKHSKDNKN